MKNKKKQKLENKQKAENDILDLDAEGFEITKFSDIHWRIIKVDDEDFKCDVWPTVKKIMSLKDYKTKKYENLYQVVREMYHEEVF